ncbi:MAG: AbrB/MazE/SpoVT family DNA-binding domain-containing protein [Deltaproteobacteria bacterium]|nr:AbrB/MazE/SpoVT family DNA-binding domain-containing protein [Deltaproteobacteria bacterium]MCZ6625161.1 AbrB/MazE/SpoVT family DNA-binding domain-containing protein [Deltaproteobacteria bacterium]
MQVSRLSAKSQVTVPKEIREILKLKPGDMIAYEVQNGAVTLRRVGPFDAAFHKALSATLDEWATPQDDEAFCDL